MSNTVMKRFTFRDDNSPRSVEVTIPEILDANYGMFVWPCAPVLAQYIWYHRLRIKGKKVLELGAGTSLPGILSAKLGADVVLSDASHLPMCLENCHKICIANEIEDKVKIIGVTWGQFSPELIQLGAVDFIISSDCFYDSKDFEEVIVTVAYLLEKNLNTEFWTSYQERSADRTIFPILEKWNLYCERIALKDFDADGPHLAGSDLPGDRTIHMMVIRHKKFR